MYNRELRFLALANNNNYRVEFHIFHINQGINDEYDE